MPKNANQEPEILSTEKLLTMIQEVRSLESYYSAAAESASGISTPAYLARLLSERGMTKQAVIEDAGLERSTGYMIFSGQRNPKRNTLLRIAFAMHLTLQETQRLLKIAQRGDLYPKNHRDAAIIYCIHNRLNLIDAELLLDQIGEELLT